MLIGLDTFWQHLRSMEHLGALLCTSKTIRAECNLVFAVEASGLDRKITKMWAQRWLGLSMSWMYLGQPMTLVVALRIAAERGGLAVTTRRGIALRQKEAAKQARKLVLEQEEKERQAVAAKELAIRLREELDLRLAREGIPRGGRQYFTVTDVLIPSGHFQLTDGEVAKIKKGFEREGADIRMRAERRRTLETLLIAAGLPTEGKFQSKIVWTYSLEINDALVADVRFRLQLETHAGYQEIYEHQKRNRGLRYAEDLENDARARFLRTYHVDADGNIGERKRKARKA